MRTMQSARNVIEIELERGADTVEVLEALKEAGWHLVNGPVLQQWSSGETEVFAAMGSVDALNITVKQQISRRSVAHMNHVGVESVNDYLRKKYGERLVEVLTNGQQSP